jgi:hypothetical protein
MDFHKASHEYHTTSDYSVCIQFLAINNTNVVAMAWIEGNTSAI